MHADETETNDGEMRTLSVRLPRELLGALRDVATARHCEVTELVRESVRSYVRPF
ncbi:MAG: hypothetical protein ABW328_05700 [Ilumatobacteraceae bacterium]